MIMLTLIVIRETVKSFVCQKIWHTFRLDQFHERGTDLHRGRRGRDRMITGFTTSCVISAYHH